MADFAPLPSLPTLPVELLRFIVTDPTDRVPGSRNWQGVSAATNKPLQQDWLAIKPTYSHISNMPVRVEIEQTLFTLRSLSQVCKRLRAFTLLMLWAVCHVSSISELGRLRETLRVSPEVAHHIKCFVFSWNAAPSRGCIEWPAQCGTMLDLAFADRRRIWTELGQAENYVVLLNLPCDELPARSYINVYDIRRSASVELEEPGVPPLIEGAPIGEDSSYDWNAFRIGSSGPDGMGEDRLIKSPDEFKACMSEIISKFTTLGTFGWSSRITPMPIETCNALSELETLDSLHVDTTGGNALMLPLWELARNLRVLSLDLVTSDSRVFNIASVVEQSEEALVSFELPAESPTTDAGLRALRYSVACRTLIAAARGGLLKRVYIDADIHHPFAVRALLPYWLGVEYLQLVAHGDPAWTFGISGIRRLFNHASIWLAEGTGSEERESRILTRQEVQSLKTHFKGAAYKEFKAYLQWLSKDGELAQQVADAWNTIVEHGEADAVKCFCKGCTAHRDGLA